MPINSHILTLSQFVWFLMHLGGHLKVPRATDSEVFMACLSLTFLQPPVSRCEGHKGPGLQQHSQGHH